MSHRITDDQRKEIEKFILSLPTSKRTTSNKKTFIKECDEGFIKLKIRYDDQCNNGYNDFSMTADISKNSSFSDRSIISCGCLHDDIVKYFPEFSHLIKWHLTSSKMPMYYFDNTLYHASDRDCHNLLKGEVRSYKKTVYFNNVPIGHTYEKELIKAIENNFDFKNAEIETYSHTDKSGYKYSDKYTFKGLYKYDKQDWYGCFFNSLDGINEFKKAVTECEIEIKSIPDSFGEGKEPDLKSARSCAIWPEAELNDFTFEKLMQRLPKLMNDFKKDIESIGFEY
jgi:hypothetical protein